MTQADYDFVATGNRRVMVTSSGLLRFAKQWPCSGLRFDDSIAVEFEYDSRGDLCNINWYDCGENPNGIDIMEPSGIDGAALVALSQGAQHFLKVSAVADRPSET